MLEKILPILTDILSFSSSLTLSSFFSPPAVCFQVSPGRKVIKLLVLFDQIFYILLDFSDLFVILAKCSKTRFTELVRTFITRLEFRSGLGKYYNASSFEITLRTLFALRSISFHCFEIILQYGKIFWFQFQV